MRVYRKSCRMFVATSTRMKMNVIEPINGRSAFCIAV
jgi:hypothetical protein